MKRDLGDGYELDDDPARIDREAAHRYLTQSYWSQAGGYYKVDDGNAQLFNVNNGQLTINGDQFGYGYNDVITIDVNAQVNGSPLDSVIELLDSRGTVLDQCVSPNFTSECVSDDEDLGVLEPAGTLRRVQQQPGEIVAVLDLRDALERDHPDAVTHGSPEMRRPACAL